MTAEQITGMLEAEGAETTGKTMESGPAALNQLLEDLAMSEDGDAASSDYDVRTEEMKKMDDDWTSGRAQARMWMPELATTEGEKVGTTNENDGVAKFEEATTSEEDRAGWHSAIGSERVTDNSRKGKIQARMMGEWPR